MVKIYGGEFIYIYIYFKGFFFFLENILSYTRKKREGPKGRGKRMKNTRNEERRGKLRSQFQFTAKHLKSRKRLKETDAAVNHRIWKTKTNLSLHLMLPNPATTSPTNKKTTTPNTNHPLAMRMAKA